ncbi:putative transcriptional regulator [Lactococcus petauri]|uniref:putative transcriptional regulator n=1 Tax=Lactococcus TaxID=1357 RepID=UPI001A9125C5|nr:MULTISPECIES: putative transcriptional regulator [Lactococcus]MCG3096742.1 putative transcriptional regulator [Lactococcus petauri]QSQ98976.1 putative transcriptional regulator [Lactococcus garvieae]
MEKVYIDNVGEVKMYSVTYYKSLFEKVWPIDELEKILLPQLKEWSNMYKAAKELIDAK